MGQENPIPHDHHNVGTGGSRIAPEEIGGGVDFTDTPQIRFTSDTSFTLGGNNSASFNIDTVLSQEGGVTVTPTTFTFPETVTVRVRFKQQVYDYTAGDRIRFILENRATGSNVENFLVSLPDSTGATNRHTFSRTFTQLVQGGDDYEFSVDTLDAGVTFASGEGSKWEVVRDPFIPTG